MTWLTRRTAVSAGALAMLAPRAWPQEVDIGSMAEIVVCQVAPFSGPLAVAGRELSRGAQICFRAANAGGGLHGKPLKLITRDDSYLPEMTVHQVKAAVREDRPIALLGLVGTLNVEALLRDGVLDREQLPVVGISSGAQSLRRPLQRQLFHVRASYRHEVARIAEQLAVMGIRRLSVFYQNDALGRDALAGLEAECQRVQLQIAGRSPYERNTTNVADAVSQLRSGQPQALVLLSNTPASIALVKQWRAAAPRGLPIIALSITDGQGLAGAVGPEQVRGVGIAQVMPSAHVPATSLVRAFQLDFRAHADSETELSYSLLEGYVGARVLVEGLRRAGARATRPALRTALESMSNFDLGGFWVRFSPDNHEGSKFVGLSVLGPSGKPLQ